MKIYYLLIAIAFSFSTLAQDHVAIDWTEEKVELEQEFMDANIQVLLGKYDEALKILKKIYKEDSSNPGLNFEMAQVYGSMNDLPLAIKHAKKASEEEPENEFYQLILGNLYIESNQANLALAPFEKLIILQPEKTEYYDMLARAYLKTGDYDNAILTFNKLESRIGFSEDLALRQVDILNESGKSDEVEAVLQKLVTIYPSNLRYRHNLATYYKKQGREQDAIKVYTEILEIDPDDASANLAIISTSDTPSEEKGYFSALQPLIESEKIPLDQKIIELIPYLDRLDSEPELGEPLLKISKTLIQMYPNEAKTHALYADVYNGTGQTDKAIDQYEKTLKLDDRVYTVWEQLIIAYGVKGDYTAMASKAEEAIDLFPNNASAYYYLATALMEKGQLDEASEYLDEAAMIAGKDIYYKVRVENQRARIAMKQKKYDVAAKHLSLSSEWSNGKDAETIELTGDLYAHKGNNKKAMEYWKQAQKKGSVSPSLESKIAKGSL